MITDIRSALSRGDLIAAFDLADTLLVAEPENYEAAYLGCLALARTGSTPQALARYRRYRLEERAEGPLAVDIAALAARLMKDTALQETEAERRRTALREAAERYRAIHARKPDSYPAINAASLFLLAGDGPEARTLAEQALAACSGEDYWAAATRAEAHLVLGRAEAAGNWLDQASKRHGGDWGAVASTRRQLRLVCPAAGVDAAVLDRLASPTICTFVGHLPGRRFPPDNEGLVRAAVERLFAERAPTIAFGSLAAGADIIQAECALEHGCELNVVLPFDAANFKDVSVTPFGANWEARFEHCLAAAASVTHAVHDALVGDNVLFGYGSRQAVGTALLRREFLEGSCVQFAVWDGQPGANDLVGTAADVALWACTGHPTWTIDPASGAIRAEPRTEPRPAPPPAAERRTLRAMMFGDVKGFSKLRECELPPFAEHILGAVARTIAPYRQAGGGLEVANTWGDGLYLVFNTATDAARCALDLQAAFRDLDFIALGLPPAMGLRLGGHFGPVFRVHDPVIDVDSYMGSHVSRAARIEPVTPEGSVYVTEEFAAELILEHPQGTVVDYVGVLDTAKSYGRLRLCALRSLGAAP